MTRHLNFGSHHSRVGISRFRVDVIVNTVFDAPLYAFLHILSNDFIHPFMFSQFINERQREIDVLDLLLAEHGIDFLDLGHEGAMEFDG